MTMSSIFQDIIIENKRETCDSNTKEIFNISALLPEDATREGGNTYGKDPLYAYKATTYGYESR